MVDIAHYNFVCPACGESLEVNDAMREALVEKGCVVCGASLTTDAFTPCATSDSGEGSPAERTDSY